MQGANGGMERGSGDRPPNNSQYAKEIRLKDRAECKRRVLWTTRQMINHKLFDKARRFKKAGERHKELVEDARIKVLGPCDIPEFAGTQILYSRRPRARGREVEN